MNDHGKIRAYVSDKMHNVHDIQKAHLFISTWQITNMVGAKVLLGIVTERIVCCTKVTKCGLGTNIMYYAMLSPI